MKNIKFIDQSYRMVIKRWRVGSLTFFIVVIRGGKLAVAIISYPFKVYLPLFVFIVWMILRNDMSSYIRYVYMLFYCKKKSVVYRY